MTAIRHRVALIGCGRMGQEYARAYTAYPDTQIVAMVDPHIERLKVVGERFGVEALFGDVDTMLSQTAPDLAAVVTPVQHMKDAVLACAAAGLKGVSVEKPIGGTLADVDAMINGCKARGVVLAGGNLQRAMHEVQHAAGLLRAGALGSLRGATVHGFGGEIVGGGCQHISVLRLLVAAEIHEVTAWGTPPEALLQDDDEGLIINGLLHLDSGLVCPVFGGPTPGRGVEVWTDEGLVRWDWGPPQIFKGFDEAGRRLPFDPAYPSYEWSEFGYLTGSIRSFLAAVEGQGQPWITGEDLRCALEVAIAAKQSALCGNTPIRLPLADRSLALFPRIYRWAGGDVSGQPQPLEEAANGRS